jgi:hypothetical protein
MLVILILTAFSVPAWAASSCGPGAKWVETCGGGSDKFNTTATANVQFDGQPAKLAVFTGPTEVVRFDAMHPVEGSDFIPTDLVSLNLSDTQGSGTTLRAGLPGVKPSVGRITEIGPGFTQASSFFDVFFELDGTPFGPLHNNLPFRLSATIDHVPPEGIQYTHQLGGVDLFDVNNVHRARILTAIHTPGPPQACSIAAPTYAGPPLWLGNTQKCAFGITAFTVSGECIDIGGLEATFSPKVSVRQAALPGDTGGWLTWSSPPFSESSSPFVGFPCASADDTLCAGQGSGASTLIVDLVTPASIVSMELEPNVFNIFATTAQFFDGPGGTGNLLVSNTLGVQGNSGARLFVGLCPSAVIKSVKASLPSAAGGFALAQLRSDQFIGIFAPEPAAPIGPVQVPADATSNATPPNQ